MNENMVHHYPLPKVTVLMPVYNAEKYLREAIESILRQTFTDFEFLIINDGSIDTSLNIIQSYKDKRIRLVNNEKNIKLVLSLNKGLKLSRGKYIVRMDADDISMPDRLIRQVNFMDENDKVIVSGANAELINSEGEKIGNSRVFTGKRLRKFFWWPSPLMHPTVIMRREKLLECGLLYDVSYIHAEDYEFWLRLNKVGIIENIPDYLLKYRIHKKSITRMYREESLKNTYKAFRKYIRNDISYKEFLSFIGMDYSISPYIRNVAFLKLVSKDPMDVFVIKNILFYTAKWIKNKIFLLSEG